MNESEFLELPETLRKAQQKLRLELVLLVLV